MSLDRSETEDNLEKHQKARNELWIRHTTSTPSNTKLTTYRQI